MFVSHLEVDVGSLRVQTDPDGFQFSLQELLLGSRFGGVQHDHDQICCSGDSDNLFSSIKMQGQVSVKLYVEVPSSYPVSCPLLKVILRIT